MAVNGPVLLNPSPYRVLTACETCFYMQLSRKWKHLGDIVSFSIPSYAAVLLVQTSNSPQFDMDMSKPCKSSAFSPEPALRRRSIDLADQDEPALHLQRPPPA